jgi:hypothetical protein
VLVQALAEMKTVPMVALAVVEVTLQAVQEQQEAQQAAKDLQAVLEAAITRLTETAVAAAVLVAQEPQQLLL